MRFIKQALFPVLVCHAAGRGDIDAMEELRQQVTVPDLHTKALHCPMDAQPDNLFPVFISVSSLCYAISL